MEYIRTLLKKHPNRIKYGLLILNLFAMIFAIRTYVNYISIETAIADAIIEKQIKTDELNFTKNFLVNYEKSDYAKYFLKHENNILMPDEYIIKFEEIYQEQQADIGTTVTPLGYEDDTITTPQESWKKFILDKINIK